MKLYHSLLIVALTFPPLASAQTNPAPAAAGTGDPGVHLRNVDLPTVLKIYSDVSGRTILRSSAIHADGFSLTNAAGSRPELVLAFEEMFRQHGIATIHDGERFVIVVPLSMTNSVRPRSNEQLAPSGASKPPVSGGIINFINTPMRQALQVYAGFTGRSFLNEQEAPWTQITLQTDSSLNVREVTYALETVFALNGVRIVPVDDHSFKIERIPVAPEARPR